MVLAIQYAIAWIVAPVIAYREGIQEKKQGFASNSYIHTRPLIWLCHMVSYSLST